MGHHAGWFGSRRFHGDARFALGGVTSLAPDTQLFVHAIDYSIDVAISEELGTETVAA